MWGIPSVPRADRMTSDAHRRRMLAAFALIFVGSAALVAPITWLVRWIHAH